MEGLIDMFHNNSLFYLGIGFMSISVLMGILFLIVFKITGKKINKSLDEEYGKPEDYNRGSRSFLYTLNRSES